MWTLVKATAAMEHYTYGRATLDMWQEGDTWLGNAYGIGSHGGHWTEYSSGAKDDVMNDLLAYAKLHETQFPFPVWIDGYGKILAIISNYEAYRIEPAGEQYKIINYHTRQTGIVDRIEDIPTEAARIRAVLGC